MLCCIYLTSIHSILYINMYHIFSFFIHLFRRYIIIDICTVSGTGTIYCCVIYRHNKSVVNLNHKHKQIYSTSNKYSSYTTRLAIFLFIYIVLEHSAVVAYCIVCIALPLIFVYWYTLSYINMLFVIDNNINI